MIKATITDEVPEEFKPQLQGVLWVCERDWIDLSIYWPSLPGDFVKRVYRDEKYIDMLERVTDRANAELDEIVEAYAAAACRRRSAARQGSEKPSRSPWRRAPRSRRKVFHSLFHSLKRPKHRPGRGESPVRCPSCRRSSTAAGGDDLSTRRRSNSAPAPRSGESAKCRARAA